MAHGVDDPCSSDGVDLACVDPINHHPKALSTSTKRARLEPTPLQLEGLLRHGCTEPRGATLLVLLALLLLRTRKAGRGAGNDEHTTGEHHDRVRAAPKLLATFTGPESY